MNIISENMSINTIKIIWMGFNILVIFPFGYLLFLLVKINFKKQLKFTDIVHP
jgi:glycopeptide antibiotics resistance protein